MRGRADQTSEPRLIASYLEGRVGVYVGDITRTSVDAVVNAANSSLLGGGGVDGAIHRAGGPMILEECRRVRNEHYPNGLPAGEAVATTAGAMPCRYVIHTVGPIWKSTPKPEETLAHAYSSSVAVARRLGLTSMAFPAISTGVYGFPKPLAAQIVARTLATEVVDPATPSIRLVFFSSPDAELFVAEAAAHVAELARD